jgi:hypothetical protein
MQALKAERAAVLPHPLQRLVGSPQDGFRCSVTLASPGCDTLSFVLNPQVTCSLLGDAAL